VVSEDSQFHHYSLAMWPQRAFVAAASCSEHCDDGDDDEMIEPNFRDENELGMETIGFPVDSNSSIVAAAGCPQTLGWFGMMACY